MIIDASTGMPIPIIRKNEIDITELEWASLNKQLTQTEIIQTLSDAIETVPMPMRKITLEEAECDFLALRELNSADLIKNGKLYARYEYKYPLNRRGISETGTYIDLCTIGNKASDYFHQESRYHCDSLNSPSPYRVWTTEKFRKNMLKNLWSMPTKKVDSTRLRSALSLRNYVASQFRPSAAKAVYDFFGAKQVLDFCSGWGDRFAGFYASSNTEHYTGVDPNLNLKGSYSRQVDTYRSLIKQTKTSAFSDNRAEKAEYAFEYDVIFTSPPYYNAERYSQDATQSWKQYKKLDEWLEKFLFKSIRLAWNTLKENGILAINIADFYGNHRRNIICDPMNDFISTLRNSEYQGVLGYRMAKRPNSNAIQGAVGDVFVEPIWCWKKVKN